jgi:vancomycin resistance protein YoaR
MRRFWPFIAFIVLGSLAAVALISPGEQTVASYSTRLEGRSGSQRHNAELAITKLRGTIIEPGATFSFNGRVGTFSRDAGYRKAPVSYNGQLIVTWGGGVCQVSTTLYNAALLAGLEIVERNHHRFAPGYVPPGRDAAVAYDTIDLKIRNPYKTPLRIEGSMSRDQLTIRLVGAMTLASRPQIVQQINQIREPRVYEIRGKGRTAHIRNSGKFGCSVTTYRDIDGKREFISCDEYPVMNKIVEYK